MDKLEDHQKIYNDEGEFEGWIVSSNVGIDTFYGKPIFIENKKIDLPEPCSSEFIRKKMEKRR
tara:strand:+ start:476 stop:664 length:189 start_codon:yes stop_codon:yes gene_type:complete